MALRHPLRPVSDRRHHKIVFAGPVGAGKSTAIAAVSDFPPVRTDELASDMTAGRKAQTTVALDYGAIALANGEKVHLYGTPGQQRFDFMWDIVTRGGAGLVLLVDNSRAEPLRDLRFFLSAFRGFIDDTQAVVGITHYDDKPHPGVTEYREELGRLGLPDVPVQVTDPRERSHVAELLASVLGRWDPLVESRADA